MTLETANRLYELRKKNNLSQEELAEKLGVSRQAVSKWERSEASPDTDNLIALAKIYNLSLDELVYGEKEDTREDAENKSNKEATDDNVEDLYINIEDDGDHVKISPEGIVVEDKNGETVKISLKGIKIETSKSYDEEDDKDKDNDDEDEDTETIYVKENGNLHIKVKKRKINTKFWLEIPYSIICVIAYLIFGFYDICGGWGLSWVIFVTIPVYYSFVEAIYKRSFSKFAYPVLAAFLFLLWGMYDIIGWHPGWIIFLTIPVYDCVASALDKVIRSRK